VRTLNKQRQSDSQRYAPFVLLAGAQTLTQKVLRAGCACAGRYVQVIMSPPEKFSVLDERFGGL